MHARCIVFVQLRHSRCHSRAWELTKRWQCCGGKPSVNRSSPLPRAARMPYTPIVDYRGRITIEPGKRSGKPCIRGLRITVYDILDYLAGGMSEDEILADFPDLERDDIHATLAFSVDQ